jgi:hypothetical protein
VSTDPQPALESPEIEQVAAVADADAAVEAAPVVVKEPEIEPAHEVEAKGIRSAIFAKAAAQPKVRIRVPKSAGPQTVIINGARWDVPANVPVEVPEMVADVLREADRI